MAKHADVLVLGAGVTGLAAAMASGGTVLEAQSLPGGICRSYYMTRSGERLAELPADAEAYRFEVGGGHWIFGEDPIVTDFLRRRSNLRFYERRSAVFFREDGIYVPYPIQNHLAYLKPSLATRALEEMVLARPIVRPSTTMRDWLHMAFGETLSDLFFDPFHKLYTAGLWDRIAPQDPHKSPVSVHDIVAGMTGQAGAVGYNATFMYPNEGLNTLVSRLSSECQIEYGCRVERVDTQAGVVYCNGGRTWSYDRLISTLPLDEMARVADVKVPPREDPATSVLVINMGVEKGSACPEDHWVYVPHSQAGFHRVGFYSNVDATFLPVSRREAGTHASVYVEFAFGRGARPDEGTARSIIAQTARELSEWGWIRSVEVSDWNWVETAYTWTWPASNWREHALRELANRGILQIGRYGRWRFQGIVASLREGFVAGGSSYRPT